HKHHVLFRQDRIGQRAAELPVHVGQIGVVQEDLNEVLIALVGLVQLELLELELYLQRCKVRLSLMKNSRNKALQNSFLCMKRSNNSELQPQQTERKSSEKGKDLRSLE